MGCATHKKHSNDTQSTRAARRHAFEYVELVAQVAVSLLLPNIVLTRSPYYSRKVNTHVSFRRHDRGCRYTRMRRFIAVRHSAGGIARTRARPRQRFSHPCSTRVCSGLYDSEPSRKISSTRHCEWGKIAQIFSPCSTRALTGAGAGYRICPH